MVDLAGIQSAYVFVHEVVGLQNERAELRSRLRRREGGDGVEALGKIRGGERAAVEDRVEELVADGITSYVWIGPGWFPRWTSISQRQKNSIWP